MSESKQAWWYTGWVILYFQHCCVLNTVVTAFIVCQLQWHGFKLLIHVNRKLVLLVHCSSLFSFLYMVLWKWILTPYFLFVLLWEYSKLLNPYILCNKCVVCVSKSPFCDSNMLFLWCSSIDADKTSFFQIS